MKTTPGFSRYLAAGSEMGRSGFDGCIYISYNIQGQFRKEVCLLRHMECKVTIFSKLLLLQYDDSKKIRLYQSQVRNSQFSVQWGVKNNDIHLFLMFAPASG